MLQMLQTLLCSIGTEWVEFGSNKLKESMHFSVAIIVLKVQVRRCYSRARTGYGHLVGCVQSCRSQNYLCSMIMRNNVICCTKCVSVFFFVCLISSLTFFFFFIRNEIDENLRTCICKN